MSGIFDDDTLYSGPTVASLPESDLIEQPGPGIGLAPARMAVPAKVDLRQDAISKMGGLDKLFSASAEIGAALQGKASPLDARIKSQREERALQLQEFKVKTDSLQDGVRLLENMTGPERDAAAASYAAKLKDIDPDLADTFTLMAKRPDFAKQIMSQYGNSPTIQRMMQADPTGKSVLAFVKTEKGVEHIQKEMDVAALPKLYQKGMSLVANWQQLVPPEMVEKFNKDKIISASELREANAWLKQNNPDVFRVMGLDDDAFAIIGRNEDAYYSALGVLAPKDEQEILKKKGEKALEPPKPPPSQKITRDTPKGTVEVQQDWIDGKWVDREQGAKFRPKDGSGGPDGKRVVDIEMKLSDDYRQDTRRFAERRPLFDAATDYMASRSQGKTSAGDASLMYAYAKMRDPSDRLAVSEVKDLAKLGNIFERFGVNVEGVLSKGQTLPDRVAKQMYDEIRRSFTQLNSAQAGIERDFERRVSDYGGKADRVVRKLSIPEDQLNPKDTSKGDKQRPFASAEEVRAAYKAGRIDRDRAKAALKQFGIE